MPVTTTRIFGVALALGVVQVVATHQPRPPQTGQCAWNAEAALRPRTTCPALSSEGEPFGPRSPWAPRPFCVASTTDSKYCVFSGIRDNKGVSLITTVDLAATVIEALDSDAPHQTGSNGPVPSPAESGSGLGYDITEVKGKGLGIIATRPIRRGEVILADLPAIVADMRFPKSVAEEDGRAMLDQVMDRLLDKQAVLSLSKSAGGAEFDDILRTNSVQIRLGDVKHIALYPEIARINHACNPTSYSRFLPQTLVMEIVAYRDIRPGEEITVSYIPIGFNHVDRQKILKSRWNFDCKCSLCSSSTHDLSASDTRRARISDIRRELQLRQHVDYDTNVALMTETLRLIEEENLAMQMAEHYELLARVYSDLGDVKNATKYGEMALQGWLEQGAEVAEESRVKGLRRFLGDLAKRVAAI